MKFNCTTCQVLAAAFVFQTVMLMAGLAYAQDQTLRIAPSVLTSTKGNPYNVLTMQAVMPMHAIFDTLTTINEDGEIVSSLAVAWSTKDAQTWIFELRPNVTFSNGEPFNAAAVVASANYLTSGRARADTIGGTLYQLEEAIALDELTVEVRLSVPHAIFPLHATDWRIAAPGHWVELGPDAFALDPVGTGPFQVTEWGETSITLVAHENSWRPPKVDALEIIQLPEQSARIQALISGAIDIATAIAPEDKTAVEAFGGTFVGRLTPNVSFIPFLTVRGESPVKDVRVRQALNYAVNRRLIIEVMLAGSTEPSGQLAFPGAFGFNPDIEAFPHDPEKAKVLLTEAGYPNGFDMELATTLRGGNDGAILQQIASDLAEVGVRVEIQTKPMMSLLSALYGGALDADAFGLFVRGHDPLITYRFRTCLGLAASRAPYHCDEDLNPMAIEARSQTDSIVAQNCIATCLHTNGKTHRAYSCGSARSSKGSALAFAAMRRCKTPSTFTKSAFATRLAAAATPQPWVSRRPATR